MPGASDTAADPGAGPARTREGRHEAGAQAVPPGIPGAPPIVPPPLAPGCTPLFCSAGIPVGGVYIRSPRGDDIDAACGQLAARELVTISPRA